MADVIVPKRGPLFGKKKVATSTAPPKPVPKVPPKPVTRIPPRPLPVRQVPGRTMPRPVQKPVTPTPKAPVAPAPKPVGIPPAKACQKLEAPTELTKKPGEKLEPKGMDPALKTKLIISGAIVGVAVIAVVIILVLGKSYTEEVVSKTALLIPFLIKRNR